MCSAVIVALILLCLIDLIASSKDQVYMFCQVYMFLYYIIFFVMYVCKVTIVNAILCLFVYDEDINLTIGLRRELKYIDWLSHTFVTSFFYLSFSLKLKLKKQLKIN